LLVDIKEDDVLAFIASFIFLECMVFTVQGLAETFFSPGILILTGGGLTQNRRWWPPYLAAFTVIM